MWRVLIELSGRIISPSSSLETLTAAFNTRGLVLALTDLGKLDKINSLLKFSTRHLGMKDIMHPILRFNWDVNGTSFLH